MLYAHRHAVRPVVVTVIRTSPDTTNSSTSASSPRQVRFAPTSTSSRPLTTIEQWSLYNFEVHARACRKCYDPLAVYKAGRRLCDEGNVLCADVALHVYRDDGEYYSTRSESYNPIRVEVPEGYGHTRNVLKVMEKQRRLARRSAAPSRHTRHDSVLGDVEEPHFVRTQETSPRRRTVVVEQSPRYDEIISQEREWIKSSEHRRKRHQW